jgi:O-antigen/teichoic acid export membrane protein
MIFIIASAIIFQSFNVVDMYFQSKVMSKYVVYANILSLFISSLVKIALILTDAPLIDFAWAVLFDSFILAVGLLYFYFHNKLSVKSWKFELNIAKKLLSSSWPLIFSSVFVSIYMKIDQVMIKEYLNVYSVGLYAAAIKLILAVNFIGNIIVTSLFPSLVKSINNQEITKDKFEKIFQLLFIIGLFLTLLFIIFSSDIITIVYGEQYSEADSIIYIYALTIVFVYFGLATSKYLIASNNQIIIIYRMMIGAIINIILNIILIPSYGLIGAAISTLIAQIFTSMVFNLFNKSTRFIFVMQLQSFFFLNLKRS